MATPAMSQARVLAVCQALFTAALSVDLTLTGLVGYTLAPDKALATLPFALITVASAFTAIAAAFVIERCGRRLAFCLGGLACTAGGLVSCGPSRTGTSSLSASAPRWSVCSRPSHASTAWPQPMPLRWRKSRAPSPRC